MMMWLSRGWQRWGKLQRFPHLFTMETPKSSPAMQVRTNSTDLTIEVPKVQQPSYFQQHFTSIETKDFGLHDECAHVSLHKCAENLITHEARPPETRKSSSAILTNLTDMNMKKASKVPQSSFEQNFARVRTLGIHDIGTSGPLHNLDSDLLSMETQKSSPTNQMHTSSTDFYSAPTGFDFSNIQSGFANLFLRLKSAVSPTYQKHTSSTDSHTTLTSFDLKNVQSGFASFFSKLKSAVSPTYQKHTSSTDSHVTLTSFDLKNVQSGFASFFSRLKNTVSSTYQKHTGLTGSHNTSTNIDFSNVQSEFASISTRLKNTISPAYQKHTGSAGFHIMPTRMDFSNTQSRLKKSPSLLFETFVPAPVQQLVTQITEGTYKEIENGKTCWRLQGDKKHTRTYREMMSVIDFKRDAFKTAAVCSVAVLPYPLSVPLAASILMKPRKLLPRSLWWTKQKKVYLADNHKERATFQEAVVSNHFDKVRHYPTDDNTRIEIGILRQVLHREEVVRNEEMMAIRLNCKYAAPFSLENCDYHIKRALCKILEVNSFGPALLLSERLHKKALEIMEMDKKLSQMRLSELSPQEIMDANYMRGLNAPELSRAANEYWLRNWLALSSQCDETDAWFLLNAMMFKSINFTEENFQRCVVD